MMCLKEKAQQIIDACELLGITVHRYDAASSESIYLAFDYGILGALRLSNHPTKSKHDEQRFNMSENFEYRRTRLDPDSGKRKYYYSTDDVDVFIEDLMHERKRLRKKWLDFRYEYKVEQCAKRGMLRKKYMWRKAKLVQEVFEL